MEQKNKPEIKNALEHAENIERTIFSSSPEKTRPGTLQRLTVARDEGGKFRRLAEVRSELTSISAENQNQVLENEQVIIESLPAVIGGDSPSGILGEKDLKRRIAKAKETAPKGYKEKLVVISDYQLLREACDAIIGAQLKYLDAEAQSITHLVLNGDMLDFTQQSTFSHDNERGDSVTIDELEAGKWLIAWINERFPHAKKIFNKGNHENRYDNMFENRTDGVKQWLVPFVEMFNLQGWTINEYGGGNSYDWHGRLIRHGYKGGAKTNIPKSEFEESLVPTTVGHATTNRMWEVVDANGNSYQSFVHAGGSKVANYDKSGNKKPSGGMGVYYWTEVRGQKVENCYQVIMTPKNPRFISPEGNFYDGEGFNLRQEIGLDPKPSRGRPRKIWK